MTFCLVFAILRCHEMRIVEKRKALSFHSHSHIGHESCLKEYDLKCKTASVRNEIFAKN